MGKCYLTEFSNRKSCTSNTKLGKDNRNPKFMLHISVNDGGRSGLSYKFSLDDKK